MLNDPTNLGFPLSEVISQRRVVEMRRRQVMSSIHQSRDIGVLTKVCVFTKVERA